MRVCREREDMFRTHTHIHTLTRCIRRVSYPRLFIEPAWHMPISCSEGQQKAPFHDVPFNEEDPRTHEFVDPVAAKTMSKETGASMQKVCIVFPSLRKTDSKGTEILVKARVVVRV